jgi:hypothetical protein
LKEKGANSIVATAGIDKSDAMFIYLIKDNKKALLIYQWCFFIIGNTLKALVYSNILFTCLMAMI